MKKILFYLLAFGVIMLAGWLYENVNLTTGILAIVALLLAGWFIKKSSDK